MSYNGYKNYETWCVNLWLNNDEGSYRWLTELLKNHKEDTAAAPVLSDEIIDNNPLVDAATMYHDILTAALQEVDFLEIVRANREA